MLRKLFRNPLSSSISFARSPEIKKYLCMREAISPSSKSSSEGFKSLQSRYGLSSKDLISLISVLNLSPQAYRYHPCPNALALKLEEIQRNYRLSPFFSANESLEERQRSLKNEYPEVLNYLSSLTERKAALQQLQSIVLNNEGKPYDFKELSQRLDQHQEELANKSIFTGVDLVETIEEIKTSFKNDAQMAALDLLAVSESYGLKAAQQIEEKTGSLQNSEDLQQAQYAKQASKYKGLTVKELQENDMIDEIEFQKFLEENNVALRDNAVGLAEWVNDRKLVFQSDIPIEFNSFRFKGFLFGCLAFLSLGAFTLVVYHGDAKFATLLVLPAFALISAKLGHNNLKFLGPKYLQRAWVHRDGKHIDFETVSSSGNSLYRDVPIKEFRVFRNGNTPIDFTKVFNQRENPLNITKLSDVTTNDMVIVPSYLFEAGNVAGFVPYLGQNNKFAWENILKNLELDTKLV